MEKTRTIKKIKPLIIGTGGYIGSHLHAYYSQYFNEIDGFDRNATDNRMVRFDLRRCAIDFERYALKGVKAGILCAGISQIETCQQEPDKTFQVNVKGVISVIDRMQACGIKPVYLSTDHVFNGCKAIPYKEEDALEPVNEYGYQKKEVEKHLCGSGKPYLILRLSKAYSVDRKDDSFFFKAAEALLARKTIGAASDLYFNPVEIQDLMVSIDGLLQKETTGIFHVCSQKTFSRYQMMRMLCHVLECDPVLVQKQSLKDIPGDAPYPPNVAMDCGRLTSLLDFTPRNVDQVFSKLKKTILRR